MCSSSPCECAHVASASICAGVYSVPSSVLSAIETTRG